MSLEWAGLIGILLFLILIFFEIPVGICMGVVGFVGLGLIRGWDSGFSVLGLQYYRTAATYTFSVIPLFVLMGFLASEIGISADGFIAVRNWLGHFKGGLAMATMVACAIFSAICGDSIATATTLAAVGLPEMRKQKYSDVLSLGVLASGGNLGFLIPPSLGFVFYAIITEQSIGNLFLSGIGPGILLTAIFLITIAVWCRIDPHLGPASASVSWNKRLVSLRHIITPAIVIVWVLGGIYTGFVTPIEAAAAGTFIIYVIGIAMRRLTKNAFTNSLYETGKLTGRIFILVSGALVLTRFITISELPARLAEMVSSINLPPIAILWFIMIFYIIIGFILDIMSIILIVAPVLHFVLAGLGFNPVYLGSITMITILMGQISPPFGIVVFGLKAFVPDVPVWTIYRGCLPFLGAMLIGLAICIHVPAIELFLIPKY